MNRPVIFLDFDGVLNTERHQARLAVEGKPNKDAWGPLFDPSAVENLRLIIDNTDAAIVISSSWRYAHRLGSLRMIVGGAGVAWRDYRHYPLRRHIHLAWRGYRMLA